MITTEQNPEVFRECFIEAFVDQHSPFYTERILKPVPCSDGVCYYGYLWDCMKSWELVSLTFATHYINTQTGMIHAMCDLHPPSYFPRNRQWARNTVFTFPASDLEKMIEILPEDCYFFDDSFSWAIALTHEESKPGRRLIAFAKSDL